MPGCARLSPFHPILRILVLVAVVLGVLGVSTDPAAATGNDTCGQQLDTAPPGTWSHVVWIVMENQSYGDIIGSSSAPYINSVASKCGLATNFFSEGHPSLPNYIAMTSGGTQGIADDASPPSHPVNVPSIFSQLSGGGSRSLEESMPSNCDQADANPYAARHNPEVYYTNLGSDCANYDMPLGASPDVSTRFTLVTPNLCNDMHQCSIGTGDAWLSQFIPQIVSTADYQAGKTAIFLTWDEEADTGGNNHIVTEVLSAHTPPGAQSAATINHYSMLATTEDMLGLPRLGNAIGAPSMGPDFGLEAASVATDPQGNWVGSYGAGGYDLAAWDGGSDVVSMPGASVSLAQGDRYVWGSNSSDASELESLDKTSRVAATYWDWNEVQVQVSFAAAFNGNLELYAVDADDNGRRETITVGGQTAYLSSDFGNGAWAIFPINVAAGSSVMIKVDRTAGANAVLSGIFLGGGGSPPPMTRGNALKVADFEHSFFDSTNGSVVTSTDQSYSGSSSAKILMQADSINRGWTWQDPSNFCAGSGTNDVNTFAPVGSNRSISGEFYITDPQHTVGVRLLALSYDNGDCLGQSTGSMIGVYLTGGSVYLYSSNYGGSCAGCNETDFSPTVDISGMANQWVNLEVRVHVARDNTGWAQLVVSGKATPVVYGPTLTTPWGNYNAIQWGAGWAQPGTATQSLYLDNATLSSF